MPWPKPLLRNNPNAHKNDFGHVLLIGGSPLMLGAPALSALSAMRMGSGLLTCAIPQSLNLTLHKKLSPVIMTLPLGTAKDHQFKPSHLAAIKNKITKFNALAIGPGMGRDPGVERFIRRVIQDIDLPMVIDADALNALEGKTDILLKQNNVKILTPHVGEMARLTGLSPNRIDSNRQAIAVAFTRKYHCILVLKGRHTVVANYDGKCYVNTTGNAGMATAGSGDVLTGMLLSLLGQGIKPFDAACRAVFYHGKLGDRAARLKGKASLIATDLIDLIKI